MGEEVRLEGVELGYLVEDLDGDEKAEAAQPIAATPLLVSVETNRPRAATPISDAATTSAMRSARPSPSAKLIRVPEIVVSSPRGKSSAPTVSAESATTRVATRQNVMVVAYLVSSRRVRPAGATSR